MFRVGAFISIALVLSLFFGCNEKTSEAQQTGLEVGFPNCLTFNAQVFVDDNFVGSFSSERAWFIPIAAGSHTIKAQSNLVVVSGETKYCWMESFSVADGQTTYLNLNCDTAECLAGE